MIYKVFNKKVSIAIIFLSIAFQLNAQFLVRNVKDSLTLKEGKGIIFCLPKTSVDVEIIVEKKIYAKGPYAEFARELLGTNDVVSENNAKYSIKEIIISTHPEPDPDQFYVIRRKNCFFSQGKLSQINLTSGGYIKAINLENENAPVSNFPAVISFSPDHLIPGQESPEHFTYQLNNGLIDPPKEVFQIADSNGNVLPFNLPLSNVKKEQSLEETAKGAAKDLAQIRDNRNKLLSGYQETNYEKGTLELMTSQLKTMEDKILTLFRGTLRVEKLSYKYSISPSKTDSLSNPLCYFSSKNGISESANSNNEAIRLKFNKLHPTEIIDTIVSKKKSKNANKGIPYRISSDTECQLFAGNKVIFITKLLIAQYGRIGRLPENVKSVEFFPESGGIKRMVIK